MKSKFPKKLMITALSILLFPIAAAAVDVNKSIRIGNVGEGADAYVDISSAGEGLTAIPYIRISGSPEGKTKEAERKIETGKLPGNILNEGKSGEKFDPANGGISLSSGSRFLKEARKGLKSGIKHDSRAGKTTTGATGATIDKGGNAGNEGANIVVCENCTNRGMDPVTLIQ